MSSKYILNRPESILSDAWLRIGDAHGIDVENQLIGREKEDIENPGKLEVSLMRNADYLGFAAKTLCDIELFPEQAVMMEEMWNRPFPMVVASRGFSKLLRSNEKIRVKGGWRTIE